MNDEADEIISIGDDFRRYDRKFWGKRDRARAAREEQQADLSDQWILPAERAKPPDHVMTWQLHGPTKRDEEMRRRLNLKRLEEKHGLRPPSWV
jgi:hypothetical protein